MGVFPLSCLVKFIRQLANHSSNKIQITMKEFLFLFRGGDAGRLNDQQSPEQWQQHMMKWKTWMESLTKQGTMTGGQPLTKEGKVLTGSKKKLTDGPFVEGK